MEYKPISLKVKHSFLLSQSITYNSTQTTQLQTININLVLAFGLMAVELASVVKDEELLKSLTHPRAFARLPMFRRHFRGTQNSGFHR